MARKQFRLATITVDTGWHSDDQLYMHCEQLFNQWLWRELEGRWCKLHASDLTYKPVMDYCEDGSFSCKLFVYGRLEETDYSYYLLKFKGEKN